jgi:cobalt-zinc-cadmium efflux system protein
MNCWKGAASLDIDELKRNLRRSIPEVRDVHHVHVWLVGKNR